MSLETIMQGIVSRFLPQPQADNQDDILRLSRYKDAYILPVVRKNHALADEGSYFVTNNAQTAIAGDTSVAFTATKPTIWIFNSDSPGNQSAKRIHLDYIYLLSGGTAYSNATSNTGFFCAVVIDNPSAATTGGSDLTPNIVCPNIDVSKKASIATVRYGALTAPAATQNARTIVGQRLLRAPVSGTAITLANVDQFMLNFGGVEPNLALPNAASATVEANAVGRMLHLPPVVIGPGQSAFIYLFMVANSAGVGGTMYPEIAWWER